MEKINEILTIAGKKVVVRYTKNNPCHECSLFRQCGTEGDIFAECCKYTGRLVKGWHEDSYFVEVEQPEADLEAEIDRFYGMYRKDGKTYDIEDDEECADWKEMCNPFFEIAFARHFAEWGAEHLKR